MSKSLKKAKRCYGCGAVLQTEDPELEGYVSKDVSLENDVVLCNNCYSLRNYNEETHLKPIISQEFFKIIDNAKKTNSLFVYIVDLFNFESSFISEINEALKGSTVLLVANKRDLLPSSVKDEKLFEYVKKRTEEAGLIVSEIMLASSTTNYNIDLFLERMAELRNNRNVYVIGSVAEKVRLSTLFYVFIKTKHRITFQRVFTQIRRLKSLKFQLTKRPHFMKHRACY